MFGKTKRDLIHFTVYYSVDYRFGDFFLAFFKVSQQCNFGGIYGGT